MTFSGSPAYGVGPRPVTRRRGGGPRLSADEGRSRLPRATQSLSGRTGRDARAAARQGWFRRVSGSQAGGQGHDEPATTGRCTPKRIKVVHHYSSRFVRFSIRREPLSF